MKLITENLETKTIIEELNESADKNYYIEGIFLQGAMVNGNGRMYPMEVLESAVKKYQPMIDANRALGELNHPATPQINFERAAIKTMSLTLEGNNYIGKAKLLSTPLGELCKGLVRDGVQLAVSSRGLGSVKESNGQTIVQGDFILAAAADVVSDPSAPNAFVQGIVENQEWVYGEGGMLIETTLDAIKKIANSNVNELNLKQEEMFAAYIKMLSK